MQAETAYLFRHAVVREAAYGLQLPSDREQLHSIAAEVIETQHADSLDAVSAEIARHLKLGGAGPEQEREFVLKGSRYAQDNFDHDTTIEMLERLAEIGNEADQQGAHQLLYAAYIRYRNDYARARQHALGLLRLGRSTGKAGVVSRALSLFATSRTGIRSIRLNRRAYRIAVRVSSWLPAGLALGNLGMNLMTVDRRKGVRVLRRAIALNERAGNRAGVGFFRGILSSKMLAEGHLAEAESLAKDAVAILTDIKAKQYLPMAYANQAKVLEKQGRSEAADQVLLRGIEVGLETGIALDIGALSYQRACLCLRRGLRDEAAELWRTTRTLYSEAGYFEDLEGQRQSLQKLCNELGVPMPE